MTASTTMRHCADCGGEVSDFSAADLCTDHDEMGYCLLSPDPDGEDGEDSSTWCLAA